LTDGLFKGPLSGCRTVKQQRGGEIEYEGICQGQSWKEGENRPCAGKKGISGIEQGENSGKERVFKPVGELRRDIRAPTTWKEAGRSLKDPKASHEKRGKKYSALFSKTISPAGGRCFTEKRGNASARGGFRNLVY